MGIIKPDDVKKTSNGILHNLAILFVPAGVGIINSYDEIKGKAGLLVVLVIIGTAVTMGLTGKIIELLQRRKDVEQHHLHHNRCIELEQQSYLIDQFVKPLEVHHHQ